jgi:hypothetical protein
MNMKTELEIYRERIQGEVEVGNFNRAFRLCNKVKKEFGAEEWALSSAFVLKAQAQVRAKLTPDISTSPNWKVPIIEPRVPEPPQRYA